MRATASRAAPAPGPRRRGRPPRLSGPVVPTSLKIPVHVYDRYCQAALQTGESLHAVLVRALAAAAPEFR